jgi:hypothetical protein
MIKLYNENGKLVFQPSKKMTTFFFLLLGEHFRCFIDVTWWPVTIINHEAFDLRHENSPFQCYIIRWDNGENEERLSPWDIFACDDTRMKMFVY